MMPLTSTSQANLVRFNVRRIIEAQLFAEDRHEQ
jgi:hypothetical protein